MKMTNEQVVKNGVLGATVGSYVVGLTWLGIGAVKGMTVGKYLLWSVPIAVGAATIGFAVGVVATPKK